MILALLASIPLRIFVILLALPATGQKQMQIL